ncbi:helix-hairpin-helix domain-containing protein [Enterobacteriaceae bacterium LUAb1]
MKFKVQNLLLVLILGASIQAFSAMETEVPPEPPALSSTGNQAIDLKSPDEEQRGKVSINNATAEQLAAAMAGVGLKKAESIVSYREKYGTFTQLEQLSEVPGIGRALLERNLDKLKL